MWGEPIPKWRTARKQHQCQGEGCAKVIATGERYLDKAIRHPTNSHLRYCQECAEPEPSRATGYHFFNGRNDFPDRYHEYISSTQWKNLKRKIFEQRGGRCQQCGVVSASLALHHAHYHSLGCEQPEDVELLCLDCHRQADEARTAKSRPKYVEPEEVWIVGPHGYHWSKLDPDTVYIPLGNSRYVPVSFTRKGKA